MQYANIIIDHRAGYEPLTYAIPPEILPYLQMGSVVMVPLGPQKVHGVVTSFIRRLDEEVAHKLKPVISVVYEGPFVPTYLIEAAFNLHKRFSYGIGASLFCFLPQFPKRKQPSYVVQPLVHSSVYKTSELLLRITDRPTAYSLMANKLAKSKQSILIICQSQAAVEKLFQLLAPKFECVLCPHSGEHKAKREYFIQALQNDSPKIFLGTRGALCTPLNSIGAMVVDEPWLPGHKEENAPKLWTAIAAQNICKTRGIPLQLVSSIAWPETRMLDSPRIYNKNVITSPLQLLPRRPIAEIISQFLASDRTKLPNRAIFVKENNREVFWCRQCKLSGSIGGKCPVCRSERLLIPPTTKEGICNELRKHSFTGTVTVFGAEELEQFQHFSSVLALNFDVYLSIVDFRSSSYLRTIVTLLQNQSMQAFLVTAHQDDWTPVIQFQQSIDTEMAYRRKYSLPPFSLPIQLVSSKKEVLEKLSLPEDTIKSGRIRFHNGNYQCSFLLKPTATIPSEWQKKSSLKVDIFPNYIE